MVSNLKLVSLKIACSPVKAGVYNIVNLAGLLEGLSSVEASCSTRMLPSKRNVFSFISLLQNVFRKGNSIKTEALWFLFLLLGTKFVYF